jgi:hypothetical protein
VDLQDRLRIPDFGELLKLTTLLEVFAKVLPQHNAALADHVGENPVET